MIFIKNLTEFLLSYEISLKKIALSHRFQSTAYGMYVLSAFKWLNKIDFFKNEKSKLH